MIVYIYICKTQIDVQSLIDIKSSNPCPISTLQTQSKTKTTLNNRLKKHAKQNCHYNYFSIYSISLFSIYFFGILQLKQENEFIGCTNLKNQT